MYKMRNILAVICLMMSAPLVWGWETAGLLVRVQEYPGESGAYLVELIRFRTNESAPASGSPGLEREIKDELGKKFGGKNIGDLRLGDTGIRIARDFLVLREGAFAHASSAAKPPDSGSLSGHDFYFTGEITRLTDGSGDFRLSFDHRDSRDGSVGLPPRAVTSCRGLTGAFGKLLVCGLVSGGGASPSATNASSPLNTL
jgi:hypothetical protein